MVGRVVSRWSLRPGGRSRRSARWRSGTSSRRTGWATAIASGYLLVVDVIVFAPVGAWSSRLRSRGDGGRRP